MMCSSCRLLSARAVGRSLAVATVIAMVTACSFIDDINIVFAFNQIVHGIVCSIDFVRP